LSFTVLYAKVEIAEGSLTIKKKSNKSNKKQFKGLEMSTVYTPGGVSTIGLNASDLVAPWERTRHKVTLTGYWVRLRSSEDGDKRLLLSVAWVSDEQRRLAKCFPEGWG
jgi:hypothetical protein